MRSLFLKSGSNSPSQLPDSHETTVANNQHDTGYDTVKLSALVGKRFTYLHFQTTMGYQRRPHWAEEQLYGHILVYGDKGFNIRIRRITAQSITGTEGNTMPTFPSSTLLCRHRSQLLVVAPLSPPLPSFLIPSLQHSTFLWSCFWFWERVTRSSPHYPWICYVAKITLTSQSSSLHLLGLQEGTRSITQFMQHWGPLDFPRPCECQASVLSRLSYTPSPIPSNSEHFHHLKHPHSAAVTPHFPSAPDV